MADQSMSGSGFSHPYCSNLEKKELYYHHWDADRPAKTQKPDIAGEKDQPVKLRKSGTMPFYNGVHARLGQEDQVAEGET